MSRRILLPLAMLALTQGCLVVYTRMDFVRPEEKMEPYKFESKEAWKSFYKILERFDKDKGLRIGFFIPFLFLHMHGVEFSKNAHFNDHAKSCDTNGDKQITVDEAKSYSEIVKGE